MRRRARSGSLWLWAVFLVLLVVLVVARDALLEAHADESIFYVASDASTYFSAYKDLYADIDLLESPFLFLIGSPILFMKLVGGNLFLVQLCQLALMAITLRVGFDCFSTSRGRTAFLLGSLAFPYFLFGFLSLNKEIYAMCAAIFFASYVVRGKRRHLVAALLLAMCARYYMVLALVPLLFTVPRVGRPRYGLIAALLIAISIAAPVTKALVPQYSSEDLLDVPSATGVFFSNAIDSFGYALVYPIKYFALIPLRAYSFIIDPSRTTNAMEAVVSVATLIVIALALRILTSKRPPSDLVKRLILIGFVAPIPMMWSEIMHWRYYSFVYFFFLFAVVLHSIDRPRKHKTRFVVASHA